MKKTLIATITALMILANLAHADTKTNFYEGKSQMGLTYFAMGWEGVGRDDENCRSLATTLVYTVFTLGIGPISDCVKANKRKAAVINTDLSAILNQVENGRAMIKISSKSVNGCTGFASTLYAEEDGFGGYSLFASKEDWTNGHTMGSAIKYENGLDLTFNSESTTIATPGKDGNLCQWQLGKNFNARLESIKPHTSKVSVEPTTGFGESN